MPMNLLSPGEEGLVQKIGGKPEIRQHLENLGFVVGSTVKLIAEMGGNVIVNVKDSRVAISRELAAKIYV